MNEIAVNVRFNRRKNQWFAVTRTLVEGELLHEDVFCLVEGPYTDHSGVTAWVHARGSSHTPQAVRDLKKIVENEWYQEVGRWVVK